MRILFSSTAGAGHFGPMAPFIRSCLRKGHEAMVAAPASMVETASATGAEFWAFGDPPLEEMQAVWVTLPQLSREEANRTVVGEIFGRLDATAAVPGLLDAITAWRPDLVVRETAEFGAAVAAELRGVPVTRIAIGLGEMEEYALSVAAPNVDALRQQHGLPADPSLRVIRDSAYLTLFPASLEDSVVSGARRFRDPSWLRSTGDAPFVYVTFGSVAGSVPLVAAVFEEALAALDGLDVPVLMTVGRGFDPSSLGAIPSNVRVEQWVDQASVLARATAVVGHGGGGTTLGALAAGVPLVVVPLFSSDQFLNAQQVASAGAGVCVSPSRDAIRAGLETVLTDSGFGVKAQQVADEIWSHASTDEAF